MNNTNTIPTRLLDKLPAGVKNELSKMPVERQEEFVEEYKRKTKSTGIAYLLWLFGFHYFYLGRIGLGLVFLFTGGGFFIWWLIDLFRTVGIVNNDNKDIATDVLRNLKIISQ